MHKHYHIIRRALDDYRLWWEDDAYPGFTLIVAEIDAALAFIEEEVTDD